MDLDEILAGNARFGSTPQQLAEAALGGLRCEWLGPQVIVAPWWEPARMPALGPATPRSDDRARIRLWDVATRIGPISWVKTGIGAPQLMDTIVALAIAGCQQVIFVGSVGGLVPQLAIGDLLVPTVSLAGEGASRYLQDDPQVDTFGKEMAPDAALTDRLVEAAQQHAPDSCHRGIVFSIDCGSSAVRPHRSNSGAGCRCGGDGDVGRVRGGIGLWPPGWRAIAGVGQHHPAAIAGEWTYGGRPSPSVKDSQRGDA